VDIIYLDYKKAFDSVPHRRLLHKLEGYGVSGNLLPWFTDFLNQRYQRVTVDGVHSKWCSVISGVPQGSVLGSLLFIIYINDLSENINCNIKQYMLMTLSSIPLLKTAMMYHNSNMTLTQ